MKLSKWKNPYRNSEYSKFYQSWCDMCARAGNRNGRNPSYSDVTVCERWLSYDNFFEDMADSWKPGLCLDKDSIKPGNRVYCKEYCKWMTRNENCEERNKRIAYKNPWSVDGAKEKVSGSKHFKAKKVRCVETGEVFCTPAIPEKKFNLPKGSVSNAANPKNIYHKTAAGFHWEYL